MPIEGTYGGDDDRLRRIELVTEHTLAQLDADGLLVELLDRVREVLAADTATVLLLDPSSQELVATAARGIEEEVIQGVRVPVGRGFAGRVAQGQRPVIVDRLEDYEVVNPLLRKRGLRSLLGVPMMAEGTVTGVLHVGSLEYRQFTEDDAHVLQVAADRIALATQSRLSDADRAAAVALQRSLLPDRLPTLPGVEFAARYLTGAGGVGGDWYDVFRLPSEKVVLVIGDVVGRGLRAAVVMGRLRSALRAYALESDDPADVLARLDRKVLHFEPDMMATVLCAVIEPSLDRLTLSSAGHPPPVALNPETGGVDLIDLPVDLPLGIGLDEERSARTVEMPPGALMCFYTDGLVERRSASLDGGLERLCKAVGSVEAIDSADAVCHTVMGQLVGDSPTEDDIALIAFRLTKPK